MERSEETTPQGHDGDVEKYGYEGTLEGRLGYLKGLKEGLGGKFHSKAHQEEYERLLAEKAAREATAPKE